MPQVVTHILIPIIIVALIRDYYYKKKNKKFSLHYVLIAGIGGIIPDLDVAAFWVLYFFRFSFEQIHRTALHSIFIPLILLALFFLFSKYQKPISKYKLKLNIIFLMLSIGTITHIILDMIFGSPIALFYPFINLTLGINLISLLPKELQNLAMPSLDAALLIIWLVYLESKHKISDFI